MMVADRATGTGEQGPSCLSTVRRIFFFCSAQPGNLRSALHQTLVSNAAFAASDGRLASQQFAPSGWAP